MHQASSIAVASAEDVARARERFLSREEDESLNVRRLILASWQRSQENDIDVDRINVPYLHDRDTATPLLRSATPILDTLHQQLQDEPVSIILTDNTGIVLDRRATSPELTGRLDALSLSPGYSTPRSSPARTASARRSAVGRRRWST